MYNIFLVFLVAFALTACDSSQMIKAERQGEPNIYSTSDDDYKMNQAIATTQKTLNDFEKAFLSNQYDSSSFALKVKYPTSNGHEHIWATNISIKDGKYFGIVDNLPDLTTKVKLGDKITLDKENITDWMYSDNGILRGGFTIKVIRNKMTKEDRQNFDSEFPYKIED